MVQAAATGAINFTRADPRDRWWWRSTKMLLAEVQRQNLLRWLEMRQRHYCALMAHGRLEDDDFQRMQDLARRTADAMYAELFPWEPREQSNAELAGTPESLIEQWYKLFPAPETPEGQELIRSALEAMRNHVSE